MPYSSPTTRDPRVMVAPAAQAKRTSRRPQHSFNLVWKPYQLQPFMIAPVLPGETLKTMMLQAQVWSDPLAAGMKNVGWHLEYNFFYVKFRDLAGWDTDGSIGHEMVDMLVSGASLSGFQDADGNAWTYAYPGAVDYLFEATKRVVDEYFRDEGENWDDYLLDNVPLVKIYSRGRSDAFEKLTMASAYQDRTTAVPDDMNELELSWQEWQASRDFGLTDMDYHDWMRAAGSSVRQDEQSVNLHRPEDVAYWRNFTYPSNTVEPTTGVPSTAAGWRVGARFDKRILFTEPGWLIGYTTVRPKVYLGKQQGYIAGAMQTRESWFPPQLAGQQAFSHLMFDDAAGPLKGVMDAGNVDYWIDLKDLLNNGDQFINYATPASGNTGVPFVALPAAGGARRYASGTEIMAMFADTTNGRFRADGMCSLSILGSLHRAPNNNLVLGAG